VFRFLPSPAVFPVFSNGQRSGGTKISDMVLRRSCAKDAGLLLLAGHGLT
jgi:hypothetical protein